MKTLSGIALLIILVVANNLQAKEYFCGPLSPPGQYGPFDYTDSAYKKVELPMVESAHFTSNVKNLTSGNTSYIAGDIDYTLRAFPNHYSALVAMGKLSLREKTTRPDGAQFTIECYFDRAIRFKPEDGIVRMLYGNYLLKLGGRSDDVIEQYHEAVRLEPENANINYNIGLLYLKKKDYELAIVHAKKAYESGFPLPGLKNKLIKSGKWDGELDENIDVEP
ncbi:MAG: tetratricopeptide repeat protein [Nitrosomonadaceae bacterium]